MRTIIGCMTGTSLDALDAAAVGVEGEGLSIRVRLLASRSRPLGSLGDRLRGLAEGGAMTARETARLALDFGALHAALVRELIDECGAADIVAAHGQTVLHDPPLSAQLLNPWPIAREAGCPVAFDLRGADLALGGQGAPITPLADWMMLRSGEESRAVVNLGGFCNVTVLPAGGGPEDVGGGDVCACNHVLDAAARQALLEPYDKDGRAALSGVADHTGADELASRLLAQRDADRSLGTGDEAAQWVQAWVSRLDPPALLATACEGVGRVIGRSVAGADRVLCAGGGACNAALVRAIAAHCSAPVETTDAFGVPIHMREAMSIAVLGALCADGVRITLPRVTRRGDAPLLDIAWINTGPRA